MIAPSKQFLRNLRYALSVPPIATPPAHVLLVRGHDRPDLFLEICELSAPRQERVVLRLLERLGREVLPPRAPRDRHDDVTKCRPVGLALLLDHHLHVFGEL